jgi:organic hydroperoxide reductase OsmC/OhrA
MAEEKHHYTTGLHWESERRGSLSSAGLPGLTVATPPEFPGGHPGIWSPEHLFVAAAEVCLMTTFLAIAANSKLDFVDYRSEAVGTVEKTEHGFMVTRILIRPRVSIRDLSAKEKALHIVEKSEKHCLISNSMKTAVSIEPEIIVVT